MCDTLVALGNVTSDGSVIFGKNSDREPNEAHQIVLIPANEYEEGSTVKCTYMEIPQVRSTHRVLLAKPFWIWGAEMGANDMDVVIGNEAVFTRVPYEKGPGLIGMDFIRLALERSSSAIEALNTITQLLEVYGQGGNCGYKHELYYHNSFIIADRKEAWVLETAGRQWVAEKVKDVRSISNTLSIETHWDLSSKDVVNFAREQGWLKKGEDLNFRKCYGGDLYSRLVTNFISSYKRQTCSQNFLMQNKGKITPSLVMKILRTHSPVGKENLPKMHGLLGSDVCAHASMGPVRGSQTTGSMVSHLVGKNSIHWLTATAAPCTGIFKPVWLDSGLPETGLAPEGDCDAKTFWWQHELLHRRVMRAYEERLLSYKSERDEIEDDFIKCALSVQSGDLNERKLFSFACFEQARQLTEAWSEKVQQIRALDNLPLLYKSAWNQYNRDVKIEI